MNHVVRRAMEEGVDPVTAIQLGTINVARYFGMDMELGGISPGKTADILLIDDLLSMVPSVVITDGEVVAENGRLVKAFPVYQYPEKAFNSVARPLTADDFRAQIQCNAHGSECGARHREQRPYRQNDRGALRGAGRHPAGPESRRGSAGMHRAPQRNRANLARFCERLRTQVRRGCVHGSARQSQSAGDGHECRGYGTRRE